MRDKLLHVSLPDKFKLNFSEDGASAVNRMRAQVADATDNLIVDAIIKYATENGVSDAYIIDEEFVKTALEKQIPKRPLPYKGFDGKCVCCGVIFLDRSTKHCGNCGQALDWSTSDETLT